MSTSFAKQVGAWAAKTEARTQAVYRRSVELLAEDMATTKAQGGRVPFQTGNLARSLRASTVGMPKTVTGSPTARTVGTITATLRLDQPVWLGYQAIYARRQNYGYVGADSRGRVYNQQGHYFVEAAIANWQQIVAQAAAELQASVESRRQ